MSSLSLRVWMTIIGIMIVLLVFVINYKKSNTTKTSSTKKIPTDDSNTKNSNTENNQHLNPRENTTHLINKDSILTPNDLTSAATQTSINDASYISSIQTKQGVTKVTDTQETQPAAEKINKLLQNNASKDNIEPYFVIINLHSKTATIKGSTLIKELQLAGCIFGDMNIFHCHNPMSKEKLFSISNSIAPGTLIPEEMQTTTTPSISLFFETCQEDPLFSFNTMLKVSYNLALKLDAKVLDKQRTLMTNKTIEEYRSNIMHYLQRRKYT